MFRHINYEHLNSEKEIDKLKDENDEDIKLYTVEMHSWSLSYLLEENIINRPDVAGAVLQTAS